MIFDRLVNAERYFKTHPAFAAAFAFLRRPDLATLPDGRIELDGDKLFALIQRPAGKTRAAARLESHRKYADIQFVISGHEEYGWRALADAPPVSEEFKPDNDVAFYAGPPSIWLPTPAGYFVVFFPEDLHAPLVSTGQLHKAVIKVRV
jgi:YhcH/YjgK/YiaL family protein